jgi:protein TonB
MGAARDNRVFHYAVLFSVAFHAFVLFGAPALKETSRRMTWPGPIVARLVEPAPAPAPSVAEPQPPAVKPEVKPAAKPAVQPTVKPIPSPNPAPVAMAAPEAPPKPAAEAAASTARAADPVPPVPPSAAAGAAATQQAAPAPRPGADLDADTVGKYRLLVMEAALKEKLFPRAARDNNWQGRTRLRLTFGADGRRSAVVVVRSSGRDILDREALDTVNRTDVPVPAGLRGKAFAFEFDVSFELTDN